MTADEETTTDARQLSVDKRIVIVTGPGRSGTSTIAGTLTRLGLEVPGTAIAGNQTNPAGFYEPRWVVDFHRRLLRGCGVGVQDPTPEALAITRRVGQRPQVRAELKEWLQERLDEQPSLVVKDPRLLWFADLWVATADDLGARTGFVTMLRHPAEVSASRQKYYAKGGVKNQRADDIARVAGWTNAALVAEEVSRSCPRVFVRYVDLVDEWREVLTRVGRELDLAFDPPIGPDHHPVDDFIDPGLHRVQVDWSDTQIPTSLRDLADGAWLSLAQMATAESEELRGRVQELREGYAQMMDDALALRRRTLRRREDAARRQARRRLRQKTGTVRKSGWRRLRERFR